MPCYERSYRMKIRDQALRRKTNLDAFRTRSEPPIGGSKDMSITRPEGGWNITRSPVHPGKMLREEFMKPLGISINGLALELHVPVTRISEIVNERRGITADTALRLARHFGTSADFWMNIQK